MNVRSGFIDSIGNTPLIKLKAASAATGCDIYGKAEFLNPGGSVKDRAALAMIQDAEKRGALRKGGVVVEGTAGNTGIGIALVANALRLPLGDRDARDAEPGEEGHAAPLRRRPSPGAGAALRQSRQLRALLRNRWPRRSPQRNRMARSGPTSSTMSPTATATTARPARRSTTRPTARSHGFTCSVGSGGTLAGVGMALKERNPNIRIALSDPMGSAMYNWAIKGELKSEGNSVTEGIGQGRVTKNLEGAPIDTAYQITDEDALPVLFDLIEHEGLVLGGSTAINIVGAMRLAKELGPGKTVVTILADGGQRYQSKLFNPAFLREKKLPIPPWMK